MSYGTNTGKSKAQADVESKVAEGAMKELVRLFRCARTTPRSRALAAQFRSLRPEPPPRHSLLVYF